eukprot:379526-Alexandrium_andersonii.AAC.1
MSASLVGSEMCIRDSSSRFPSVTSSARASACEPNDSWAGLRRALRMACCEQLFTGTVHLRKTPMQGRGVLEQPACVPV